MTTIEFQNLLNSFFQVEDGHIKVKDLTISDDIIKINVNDNNNRLAGFQIYRGDRPPVNIIWDEETQSINFTVGSDLTTVNWKYPKPVIKNIENDYFIKNEDIILISKPNLTIYLPPKYDKSIKIKMLDGPCRLMDKSFDVIHQLEKNKSYEFIFCDSLGWVDIN